MRTLKNKKNMIFDQTNTIAHMSKENTVDRLVLSIDETKKELINKFLESYFYISDLDRSVSVNVYDTIKKFYKTEFKYIDDDGIYHYEFEARYNSDLTFEETLIARLDVVEFINLNLKYVNTDDNEIKIDYMLANRNNFITTDEKLFNPYLVTYDCRGYNTFLFLEDHPSEYEHSECKNPDISNRKLIKAKKLVLDSKCSRIYDLIGGFYNE